MRRLSLLFLLALLGLTFPSCREQEAETRTYELTVLVTDSSERPIAGALVTVDQDRDLTNQEGKCVFSGLTAQRVKLEVSADSYEPQSQWVSLAEQGAAPLTVRLSDIPPYLSVDTEQIDTKARSGTATLQIASNTEWRLESASGALSFSPTEGKGSSVVHVHWDFPQEPEDEDLAKAEFSILSRTDAVTIPILYHLPILVTHVDVSVPNLAVHFGAPAVVHIRFSRKVRPVKSWITEPYVELDMRAADAYTVDVDIPYKMIQLGADRVLDHVAVESVLDDGITFDETVIAPLHDGQVTLEGTFRHWTFGEDESTLWLITDSPKRVYKLDARSFAVLRQFELDWLPERISFNRYNHRLYVTGEGVLRVLDAETGALVKVISKETDSLDHPQFPCNTISNVLFADNGFGIFITSNEIGTYRWFFIDSRVDDKVEHTPLEEELGDSFYEYTFSDAFLDYSRTKIISRITYNHPTLRVIDSRDKSLSSFTVRGDANAPGVEYAGGYILDQNVHREKDLMLHCFPYSMVVQDYANDTYTTPFVDFEFRTSVNDFCYGDVFGGDLCTYSILWAGGMMTIYNHSTNTVQYGTYIKEVGVGAGQALITFLEGDRVVFLTNDIWGNCCFTTINTTRFVEN